MTSQRRFIRRGVSKILFAADVANINAVTRAELDAAFDLTPFIREVTGWQLESNSVATPDLGSSFESSIPGTDSAADSSLGFYEDLDTEEIEAMLQKDTEGKVIIMRKGDKPGSASMDVHPTRVASKSADIGMGNDPAGFMAKFNITEEPSQDQVIPAIVGHPVVLTGTVLPNPVAVAGGDQVVIQGVGLLTATGLKVDGVLRADSAWIIVDDNAIVLNTAAKAAGTYQIVVVNAFGDSNPKNLTWA